MTPFEENEVDNVCYCCGHRGKGDLCVGLTEFIRVPLCIFCEHEHNVEDIDDMPFVPIPIREWYRAGN